MASVERPAMDSVRRAAQFANARFMEVTDPVGVPVKEIVRTFVQPSNMESMVRGPVSLTRAITALSRFVQPSSMLFAFTTESGLVMPERSIEYRLVEPAKADANEVSAGTRVAGANLKISSPLVEACVVAIAETKPVQSANASVMLAERYGIFVRSIAVARDPLKARAIEDGALLPLAISVT